MKHFYLIILFVAASCSGQVKTDLTQEEKNQHAAIEDSIPKIVRTLGVASGNLKCELQDRNGHIWFSTGGEGIYRYDGKTFRNFTSKDGLCSNNTGSIIQDKTGNILIGTNAGICKFDGKSFSKYFEVDSLNALKITTLFEDSNGSIWFGSINSGIYRYDGKVVVNFLHSNDHEFNLGNNTQLILDILQDKDGSLWFSSWNGGGVWRYDGKLFANFVPSKEYYQSNEDGRTIGETGTKNFFQIKGNTIADDMIFSLLEDKKGNLWFATRNHGACLYDGKIFTSFREKEGFTSRGIYDILEDIKGNMWFTTEENGVFCYDGKTFKNYTTADGLVNNSVFSILEDKEGNLWFGTRGFGLSRFDGKSFVTFSE